MRRRIVPDVYTEYEDGHLGVSGLGLASIEAKIGAAMGGYLGRLYVFSGPSGKGDAKKVLKGGPLLRAIEEAFDGGSSTIYAWRIGPAANAELTLQDSNGTPSLKLVAREPGTYWNQFDVMVSYPHDPPQQGDPATLTIRDTNTNPERVWTFTGASVQELVDLVNNGSCELEATALGQGLPAPTAAPQTLAGGDDGLNLQNQHYLDGLELTESRPEVSWIHAVGANTDTLWTAILTHCDMMLDTYNSERFALLETPLFESTAQPGSSQYMADLQTYVDGIVSMMQTTANRNGVVFAGGARFLGSDGAEYTGSIASACGGLMASLEVHKSLLNKQVRNVLGLVPEFTPGQLAQLISARVNALRLKPGRGFVVSHSLTAAPPGSDFSRVNDLRAVYFAARAARAAAQPYVGEENDAAGEGLRRLESAMSRPLEVMRDGGQIDDFSLRAVSSENDRLLGDVHVELGIRPLRAMETIYMKVFLT